MDKTQQTDAQRSGASSESDQFTLSDWLMSSEDDLPSMQPHDGGCHSEQPIWEGSMGTHHATDEEAQNHIDGINDTQAGSVWSMPCQEWAQQPDWDLDLNASVQTCGMDNLDVRLGEEEVTRPISLSTETIPLEYLESPSASNLNCSLQTDDMSYQINQEAVASPSSALQLPPKVTNACWPDLAQAIRKV
jgi:hypothetical protein